MEDKDSLIIVVPFVGSDSGTEIQIHGDSTLLDVLLIN